MATNSASEYSFVEELLSSHPYLEKISPERVRCSVTGHEMPLRLSDIQTHVKGRKYALLCASQKVLDQYGEYFRDQEWHYWCKLTEQKVARDSLANYVKGKTFLKALRAAQEQPAESSTMDSAEVKDSAEEIPEPEVSSDEEEVMELSSDGESEDNRGKDATRKSGSKADSDYEFEAAELPEPEPELEVPVRRKKRKVAPPGPEGSGPAEASARRLKRKKA